jgi:hypothetical protein
MTLRWIKQRNGVSVARVGPFRLSVFSIPHIRDGVRIELWAAVVQRKQDVLSRVRRSEWSAKRAAGKLLLSYIRREQKKLQDVLDLLEKK